MKPKSIGFSSPFNVTNKLDRSIRIPSENRESKVAKSFLQPNTTLARAFGKKASMQVPQIGKLTVGAPVTRKPDLA